MDTVRFGRALGCGARGAVKAMLAAADAASAPNPAVGPRVASPSVDATRAVARFRSTQAGIARGGRGFGQAVWRPFVRLGGVLWLELTGVFFGLFVLFAGTHAWKLRANFKETATNHIEHRHLLWAVTMAVFFGYFCISSFLRANRRGRGR